MMWSKWLAWSRRLPWNSHRHFHARSSPRGTILDEVQRMKSMFSFFQRLQWKLTLSYALVTVGTVIVLAGLLVGIVIYIDSQAPGQYSSFFWSKTAFQDNIPYLMDDQPALQRWVERIQKQGFAWTDFQSYTV